MTLNETTSLTRRLARLAVEARGPGKRKERKKTEREEEKMKKEISLSLGAPVHCPTLSVETPLGPPLRRLAAANTESSSSRRPESSCLPF